MPYSPTHLDLTSLRSYLATRRYYSGEAIALRLLLHTAPAELTSAPQLLAWMAASGQDPALLIYVARSRGGYADALRVARRRAKAKIDSEACIRAGSPAAATPASPPGESAGCRLGSSTSSP